MCTERCQKSVRVEHQLDTGAIPLTTDVKRQIRLCCAILSTSAEKLLEIFAEVTAKIPQTSNEIQN